MIGIDYRLDEVGWARMTLQIEDDLVELRASYLSHPLNSLADAALGFLEGYVRATVRIDDDPGAVLLEFTSSSGDLQLNVWKLDSEILPTDEKILSDGKLLARGNVRIDHFSRECLTVLHRQLHEHGLLGYRRKWIASDFPLLEYFWLRARLDDSPAAHALMAAWRSGRPTIDAEAALIVAPCNSCERVYERSLRVGNSLADNWLEKICEISFDTSKSEDMIPRPAREYFSAGSV